MNPLSDILPRGSEGGREFARVVDLLLFHQARRAGRQLTVFSDAAGDYHGLDSFEDDGTRLQGTTGYQYKFYASPLTTGQRKDVEASLDEAAKTKRKLKLKKWILVTPTDLVESATRKSGGDVTWFESLRNKFSKDFSCEHWGHTKLLSLFLETRHLCLYYYPSLVPDGARSWQTVEQARATYDRNFAAQHRNIEFVGMSVYKQEASRGVPMEDIYIPLSLVRGAGTVASGASRVSALSLLRPGARSVVLGDPGSGKSTLLRFLSLVGGTKALQKRSGAKRDSRLPVLVTLQRYADELRSRVNLSLLDYMKESARADFSLDLADGEFLETYLEAGRSILCFDGLDELPTSRLKSVVRDRVGALLSAFPGNTAVITSRIIGYDEPFRFDEREFNHYHVAELELPAIEQFVRDWYSARVESTQAREASSQDLLRILRDNNHTAIQELARNPLLLTIVALVHRIDAVLPDERVVLYQKCTETLLNTWHAWKYKGQEVKQRGKVERRNRARMEALALWMHRQGGSEGRNQRAVVPYASLVRELKEHIESAEKGYEADGDAEDLANDFLAFVKERAGLLVEVGDQQFSFVHLTFQEYLASAAIITQCERSGVDAIWTLVDRQLADPRWHEVVRLLIAGLKSEASQEFLIGRILAAASGARGGESLVLGGLLVDGIPSAEASANQIVQRLLLDCATVSAEADIDGIVRFLRTWGDKDFRNAELIAEVSQRCLRGARHNSSALSLILVQAVIDAEQFWAGIGFTPNVDTNCPQLMLLTAGSGVSASLDIELDRLARVQDMLALYAPFENAVSCLALSVFAARGTEDFARRLFELQLITLRGGLGPFDHLRECCDAITAHSSGSASEVPLHLRGASSHTLTRLSEVAGSDEAYASRASRSAADRAFAGTGYVPSASLGRRRDRRGDLTGDSEATQLRTSGLQSSSGGLAAYPRLADGLVTLLLDALQLVPRPQWAAALRSRLLPNIQERFDVLRPEAYEGAAQRFLAGSASALDAYLLAIALIWDVAQPIAAGSTGDLRHFTDLISRSGRTDEWPQLRIAVALRNAALRERGDLSLFYQLMKSQDAGVHEFLRRCYWTTDRGAGIAKRRSAEHRGSRT